MNLIIVIYWFNNSNDVRSCGSPGTSYLITDHSKWKVKCNEAKTCFSLMVIAIIDCTFSATYLEKLATSIGPFRFHS